MMGPRGSSVGEIAVTRLKLQDPLSGSERLADFRGSSDHFNAAQSMFQAFVSPAGRSNNPQRDPYQSYSAQHGVHHSISPSQNSYQNFNAQQAPNQNMNMQAPYQNISAQQGSYQY